MKSRLTSEYEISEVSEDQIVIARDLIHKTIRTCYPIIYPPAVVDFFLKYHSADSIRRRTQKGYMLLLFNQGQPAGTGFMQDMELGGVYILPEYQGQGMGTTVVRALINIAQNKQVESISLDATPLAKPLYLKLGFKIVYPAVQIVDGYPLFYDRMMLKSPKVSTH